MLVTCWLDGFGLVVRRAAGQPADEYSPGAVGRRREYPGAVTHRSCRHCGDPRCARHSELSPDMPVIYPLAVIADVATEACSSRARLRFASSTRIVVMCRNDREGHRIGRKEDHRPVGEHRRRWVGMHHGEGLARQGCGSHRADEIEKAQHRPRNRNTGRRRPDQGYHGDAGGETDCDVARYPWAGMRRATSAALMPSSASP